MAKKFNFYVLILCFALVLAFFVSCGNEENSVADNSSLETSSTVDESEVASSDGADSEESANEDSKESEGTDNSEQSEIAESSEDSEQSEHSEQSEEISTEPGVPQSSEAPSSESSEEPSVQSSEASSKEPSEISSEEPSEQPSKDTSEEPSVGGFDISDIPAEYRELESVKAIIAIAEKNPDAFHLVMDGQLDFMGFPINMNLEFFGDSKTGNSLSIMNISGMGSVINSSRTLVVNGVTYEIDDVSKTYCVAPEDGGDLEGLFDEVVNVETKNELVGTDIYVADWFESEDGSKFALYTKDGKIEYLSMSFPAEEVSQAMNVLMKMDIDSDISKAEFSIPEGYALADYDSFQGGSYI